MHLGSFWIHHTTPGFYTPVRSFSFATHYFCWFGLSWTTRFTTHTYLRLILHFCYRFSRGFGLVLPHCTTTVPRITWVHTYTPGPTTTSLGRMPPAHPAVTGPHLPHTFYTVYGYYLTFYLGSVVTSAYNFLVPFTPPFLFTTTLHLRTPLQFILRFTTTGSIWFVTHHNGLVPRFWFWFCTHTCHTHWFRIPAYHHAHLQFTRYRFSLDRFVYLPRFLLRFTYRLGLVHTPLGSTPATTCLPAFSCVHGYTYTVHYTPPPHTVTGLPPRSPAYTNRCYTHLCTRYLCTPQLPHTTQFIHVPGFTPVGFTHTFTRHVLRFHVLPPFLVFTLWTHVYTFTTGTFGYRFVHLDPHTVGLPLPHTTWLFSTHLLLHCRWFTRRFTCHFSFTLHGWFAGPTVYGSTWIHLHLVLPFYRFTVHTRSFSSRLVWLPRLVGSPVTGYTFLRSTHVYVHGYSSVRFGPRSVHILWFTVHGSRVSAHTYAHTHLTDTLGFTHRTWFTYTVHIHVHGSHTTALHVHGSFPLRPRSAGSRVRFSSGLRFTFGPACSYCWFYGSVHVCGFWLPHFISHILSHVLVYTPRFPFLRILSFFTLHHGILQVHHGSLRFTVRSTRYRSFLRWFWVLTTLHCRTRLHRSRSRFTCTTRFVRSAPPAHALVLHYCLVHTVVTAVRFLVYTFGYLVHVTFTRSSFSVPHTVPASLHGYSFTPYAVHTTLTRCLHYHVPGFYRFAPTVHLHHGSGFWIYVWFTTGSLHIHTAVLLV